MNDKAKKGKLGTPSPSSALGLEYAFTLMKGYRSGLYDNLVATAITKSKDILLHKRYLCRAGDRRSQ